MGWRVSECTGLGSLARGWLGALLLLGPSGCAKQETISALSANARASELRAYGDYRGERLRITAIVTGTGLKKVTRETGTATGSAISTGMVSFGSAEWQTGKKMTGFPYMMGRDPQRSEADGQLLCFFFPEDIKDVAALTPGVEVRIVGEFQEFTEGGHRIVMNSCELE